MCVEGVMCVLSEWANRCMEAVDVCERWWMCIGIVVL